MKILQIFGAVVAVHLLAFIFIFASPGCQSGPRNIPTPDATVPSNSNAAPIAYDSGITAQPVDMGTGSAPMVSYTPATISGHAAPTRPGSAAAAAITPAKPVAEVAPVSTYTVVRGDSLWTVAKKNGMSVSELAKANNLGTGATLQPGKKLIVPGKAAPAPKDLGTAPAVAPAAKAVVEKAPARPSGESVTHVVAPGESLGTIARKYQVKTAELAAANNLTSPMIRAGQTLVIPGFKAVGAKPAGSGVKSAASTPAAAPAAETPAPAVKTPHFELTPPPQGQDLDAGLKGSSTEVPTIKVETPKADQPPKN
jgi:LysM repeat protein